MKIKLLYISLLALVVLGSCKKETTVKETYTPPKPGLFGTWKMIDKSTDSVYYEFPDDNTNIFYVLTASQIGYRTSSNSVYFASDKQVILYNNAMNYEIRNDTMWMYYSLGTYNKYVKVDNSKINHKSWVRTMTKIKLADVPPGYTVSPHTFAVNGDIIYPWANGVSGQYIYQYNTLSRQFEDSVAVGEPASTCYNGGMIYVAFDNGTFPIYKTDMNTISINSSNSIPYPQSISINKSNGDIFVVENTNKLYKGADNASYSVVSDLIQDNCQYIQYYKDGEFLCMFGGKLHKVLPGVSFKVVASYDTVPGFTIYNFSTDGQYVWLYGYDNDSGDYKLMKATLN